jgi:stearoyl-CoA desaturase (delta-9 desaturase)
MTALKKDDAVPIDINIPDNYVEHTLKTTRPLPPIKWENWYKEINWLSFAILTVTPFLGILGACFVKLRWETFWFSIFYYYVTGLGELLINSRLKRAILIHKKGITAGYHRLWAHRSYNASKPLQYFLALAGAGAVEGSIKWWSRGHRAHHRYTDTDLDPYNAHKGLWWSHMGWMLVKPRRRPGVADVSDLSKNDIVKWQHRHYVQLILLMGFIVPTVIPWLLWNDAAGGYVYAGILRLCFVHHVGLSFQMNRPSVLISA